MAFSYGRGTPAHMHRERDEDGVPKPPAPHVRECRPRVHDSHLASQQLCHWERETRVTFPSPPCAGVFSQAPRVPSPPLLGDSARRCTIRTSPRCVIAHAASPITVERTARLILKRCRFTRQRVGMTHRSTANRANRLGYPRPQSIGWTAVGDVQMRPQPLSSDQSSPNAVERIGA